VLIAGHVILDIQKPVEVAKVGITFTGWTKSPQSQTQLFSVQDILWNAAPPKGKSPARNDHFADGASPPSPRRLKPTGNIVGHVFLFAIKWPLINYPPSLPPHRSVVETEYVLRAFMTIKDTDVEYFSPPLIVDFQPRIDPSFIPLSIIDKTASSAVLKDDHGKILGEADLECKNDKGVIFGSDCSFMLNLLVRQSDPRSLPHKAKIDVCEIHKLKDTKQIQSLILSHETLSFPPNILMPHRDSSIPLRVHIPLPEIDSRRGALGLPTLSIGDLIVEYRLRVSIAITHSRFSWNNSAKVLVVECPFVVGNAKPKELESKRKVPRLVVNSEGDDSWDSPSTSPLDASPTGTDVIAEWVDGCESPRFLAGGDVEEDI
jgi:hypothetical protein